jgi:protein involved in polysaccharide export with SLBB domain
MPEFFGMESPTAPALGWSLASVQPPSPRGRARWRSRFRPFLATALILSSAAPALAQASRAETAAKTADAAATLPLPSATGRPADPAKPASADPAPTKPASPAPPVPAGNLAEAAAVAPKPFLLCSDLFTVTQPAAQKVDVRMGNDYVLGQGDRLALNTFGSLSMSTVLTVDRSGKVVIPNVAVLDVRGLTLEHARTVIRFAMQKKYSHLENFSLEVVDIHDVEISMIGELVRPGSYLVPSITSAVSLLGMAGGPTEYGSYRAIQHLRGGVVIETLDLYKLRFQGKGLASGGFQDGDTLFVPLASMHLTVDGAFRRVAALPATTRAGGVIMELLPGETALEALTYAGGLLPEASQIYLTVQRISPSGVSTIQNVHTDEPTLRGCRLYEGDTLRALVRAERNEDFVEVEGCVAVPGRFAFTEGMRVYNLLSLTETGDQLLPGTYRLRGEVHRTRPDGKTELLSFDVNQALLRLPAADLALQPRDRIELVRVADLRLPARVTILGPLTRPGIYDWSEGMRASDLIFLGGVPKLSADLNFAELATLKDGNTSTVVRLDLRRLLSNEGRAAVNLLDDAVNPRLRPYDQITVYENPDFRMHRTVTISGQVKHPGPYVIREDRFSLRQLIERAGGLTGDAMPSGGIFLRSTLQPKDLSAKDPAAVGADPNDPTAQGIANINEILKRLSETKRNKDSGTLEDNPLLHGLLQGTMNRLVVDLQAILKGDAKQDVVLMDGDQIFIPRKTDSVYVVGEVASPFSNFHVSRHDTVGDIVYLAGGFTRNADESAIRLLKANGRIIDSRVKGRYIEPGDTVLVPQRISKDITWQETLLSLMPLAILYNTIHQ